MYQKNLLLVFAAFVTAPFWTGGLLAQGVMRGEEDFSATQRAVEMVKIAEEIEQAGYVLDVEEAFDEEGEEGSWISADADDIEVATLDQEEIDLLDMEDVSTIEEAIESEESDMEDADFVAVEDLVIESTDEESSFEDAESEELFSFNTEEEDTEEESATWWNEQNMDDSWNDLIDEWELEALENSYEEEDMATLEAMYEKG